MTTATHDKKQMSRGKKALFFLVTYLLILLLFFIAAEIIVRKKGLTPWTVNQRGIILETTHGPILAAPSSGLYHASHRTLGYITRPGEFRFTLPGPYTFKTTHLNTGLRITHPRNTYSTDNKKEAWIFGCSFTQGWSLNDDETYPWLLQQRLPGYEVTNFGVDGYSTLQSLIQCREALKQGRKPEFAVLAYSVGHDFRNTQTRAWLKMLEGAGTPSALGTVKLPYAKMSDNGQFRLRYVPLDYFGGSLLRHSAFANFLDDKYNRWKETTYQSHKVTLAIIDDFARLCKANDISFVLAGITLDARETLNRCQQLGMMTVDIAVDVSIPANNNLPYDGHPSAIANQQYEQKLEAFLCDKLVKCGPAADLGQDQANAHLTVSRRTMETRWTNTFLGQAQVRLPSDLQYCAASYPGD